MALKMKNFKIAYANGKDGTVSAEHRDLDGDWAVFSDGPGLILQVRANEVRRIERIELAE